MNDTTLLDIFYLCVGNCAQNSVHWWRETIASIRAAGIHDDVIKWKHFPRYWPFVRGIHRSPVYSPHKGQWRGTFMFSLICLNKQLSKQFRRRWFEMPLRSLWRLRNAHHHTAHEINRIATYLSYGIVYGKGPRIPLSLKRANVITSVPQSPEY